MNIKIYITYYFEWMIKCRSITSVHGGIPFFNISIGWSSASYSLCTYIEHNPLRRFAHILHLSQVFKRRSLEKDLSHAPDPTGRVRRRCSMLLGKTISLHFRTDSACPQATSANILHFSIFFATSSLLAELQFGAGKSWANSLRISKLGSNSDK